MPSLGNAALLGVPGGQGLCQPHLRLLSPSACVPSDTSEGVAGSGWRRADGPEGGHPSMGSWVWPHGTRPPACGGEAPLMEGRVGRERVLACVCQGQ